MTVGFFFSTWCLYDNLTSIRVGCRFLNSKCLSVLTVLLYTYIYLSYRLLRKTSEISIVYEHNG